jgi:hypothetical protein
MTWPWENNPGWDPTKFPEFPVGSKFFPVETNILIFLGKNKLKQIENWKNN